MTTLEEKLGYTFQNTALLENAGLELADTVTPENFPAIKQLILDVFSALTDGKAEYSLTTDFIPYAG